MPHNKITGMLSSLDFYVVWTTYKPWVWFTSRLTGFA